jgi:hypothetical protein
MAKHTRFIDNDLNRSFARVPAEVHEERLAEKLLPLAQDVPFVLDIHTTSAAIVMTPIVSSLNKNVRKIINLTTSKEVIKMSTVIAKHALIGNVTTGVSLEFNEKYAEEEQTLVETIGLIESLLDGRQQAPSQRRVFHVDSTIPLTTILPSDAQDFEKIASLGIYPFLLHEREYRAYRGCAAKTYTMRIM